MGLSDDNKSVLMYEKGDRSETYEDFVGKLPKD